MCIVLLYLVYEIRCVLVYIQVDTLYSIIVQGAQSPVDAYYNQFRRHINC